MTMIRATVTELLHVILVSLAEKTGHLEDSGKFKFNRDRGHYRYQGWLEDVSKKRDQLLRDLIGMKASVPNSEFFPFRGITFTADDVITLQYKFIGLGIEFIIEYVDDSNTLRRYRALIPTVVLVHGDALMREELEHAIDNC